jgi:hypothetical protein
MRRPIVSVLAGLIVLVWTVQWTHAGVIRSTGKTVQQGSITLAQKTSDTVGAATSGAGDAVKATPGALKTGTAAVGKGAASTPGLAVRATKAAPSKIWRTIW